MCITLDSTDPLNVHTFMCRIYVFNSENELSIFQFLQVLYSHACNGTQGEILSSCTNNINFVGCFLAVIVFVGKLPVAGWVYVIIAYDIGYNIG